MAKVLIGTSGFSYRHWAQGVFYPRGVSERKWLNYYSGLFDTVELNVSFYRLPKKGTFSNWAKQTPKNFRFSIKGSRYITHSKKLHEPREALKRFSDSVSGLDGKIEVVLWQLPANFGLNLKRLKEFCAAINKDPLLRKIRHTFEFRNASWFSEETFNLLKKYNFALSVTDSPIWPAKTTITASFVYLRMHGGKRLYTSEYSNKELHPWAQKVKRWQRQNLDVYVYFNNDAFGFAPKNALYLKDVLSKKIGA